MSGPEVGLRGSKLTSSTSLSRGRPARRALSGARSGRGAEPWALVLARGKPTRGTPSEPSPSQRRGERTRHNVDKGRRRAARLAGRLPSCAAATARRLRAVLRRLGISQVQTWSLSSRARRTRLFSRSYGLIGQRCSAAMGAEADSPQPPGFTVAIRHGRLASKRRR